MKEKTVDMPVPIIKKDFTISKETAIILKGLQELDEIAKKEARNHFRKYADYIDSMIMGLAGEEKTMTQETLELHNNCRQWLEIIPPNEWVNTATINVYCPYWEEPPCYEGLTKEDAIQIINYLNKVFELNGI